MKRSIIFALIGFLLFAGVKSQGQTTRPPVTISQANQNLITSKVQQFTSDLQAMRNSSSFDSQKLIADIQAIIAAARMSGMTIPSRVNSLVQDLIINVQQMERLPGKNNQNQIMMAISGIKEEVMREISMAQASLAMTG